MHDLRRELVVKRLQKQRRVSVTRDPKLEFILHDFNSSDEKTCTPWL